MARNFRTAVIDLVAGLRATGPNDDAAAIRKRALTLDSSDQMKQALAGPPRPPTG
jgi:hypothetical protein